MAHWFLRLLGVVGHTTALVLFLTEYQVSFHLSSISSLTNCYHHLLQPVNVYQYIKFLELFHVPFYVYYAFMAVFVLSRIAAIIDSTQSPGVIIADLKGLTAMNLGFVCFCVTNMFMMRMWRWLYDAAFY